MTTTHVKSAVTGDFVVVPMAHEPEGDSKNPILPEGIDALGFDVKAFLAAAEWNADEGSTVIHHPVGKGTPRKVVFVGLGAAARVGEETWRRAGGHASRMLGGKESTTAVIGDGVGPAAARCASAFAEGWHLARYRFDLSKRGAKARADYPSKGALTLVVGKDHAAETIAAVAVMRAIVNGTNVARELGNLPGNLGTATKIAAAAVKIGRHDGFRVKVLDPAACRKLGMGSFLSVGNGSDEPCRFLVLEHGRRKPGRKTVAFVGKGVTFDAGGISIKPAGEMDKMRHDKCGGTAVIGLFSALAGMKADIHALGFVPLTENLLGGSATRPGDLVTAMDGTTIEVLNTDAEGRLILCDAILHARSMKPDMIIDMATLTGACVVALGGTYAALFSTSDTLAESIAAAGTAAHERVWRMPLDDDYTAMMRGTYGDLKNIGGPKAGSITAASFLRTFAGDVPWAHLDIAGVAYDDGGKPYHAPQGATGFGVRLLTRWVADGIRSGAFETPKAAKGRGTR
ncbi:MAG: putative cytosol aminopeptidase [Planctomycetota bacterium]